MRIKTILHTIDIRLPKKCPEVGGIPRVPSTLKRLRVNRERYEKPKRKKKTRMGGELQ